MAKYSSSDISSGNKYGYKNGGNGLTNPIHYPNNLSSRNDVTGDSIRTGYKNQEVFSENLSKIKKIREEETLPNDYKDDKFAVLSECEDCGVIFKGNARRGICFICSK